MKKMHGKPCVKCPFVKLGMGEMLDAPLHTEGQSLRHTYHRIGRRLPRRCRIVHHDADDQRYKIRHQCSAVAYLIAVDLALPGSTAMHELIAEHVEAWQQDGEQCQRSLFCQCLVCLASGLTEQRIPGIRRQRAVLGFPKRWEDVGVLQQQADRPGVFMPQHVLNELAGIETENLGKKAFKHLVLRSCALGAETRCISRIERDPQEDEAGVDVLAALLGLVQPTECPVHAQAERRVVSLTFLAVALFQFLVGYRFHRDRWTLNAKEKMPCRVT